MNERDQFISTLEDVKKKLNEDEFTVYLWLNEDLLDSRTACLNFSPKDFDKWCYNHIWLPKIREYESIPFKPNMRIIYFYCKPKLLDSLRACVLVRNTDADRLLWKDNHWVIIKGKVLTLKCVISNFDDSIPLAEFLNFISSKTTSFNLATEKKVNIYRTISIISTKPPHKLYLNRTCFDKIFTPFTAWTSKMHIIKFTMDGFMSLDK